MCLGVGFPVDQDAVDLTLHRRCFSTAGGGCSKGGVAAGGGTGERCITTNINAALNVVTRDVTVVSAAVCIGGTVDGGCRCGSNNAGCASNIGITTNLEVINQTRGLINRF